MLFITAEVAISYMDLCPDMVMEVADFGDSGKEADTKEEKKSDKFFSFYTPEFLQKEYLSASSLQSLRSYPDIFIAILTPPPIA